MTKTKIIVGITPHNELYQIEIEQPHEAHPYFSMTGTTYRLLNAKEAEENAPEMIGESWQDVVVSGQTELGKDEWVEYVINTDGWENNFDIEYDFGTFNDDEYYLEHSAGGQHEEKEMGTYLIEKSELENLLRIWFTYHLKREPLPEHEQKIIDDIVNKQDGNREELVEKAVSIMIENA